MLASTTSKENVYDDIDDDDNSAMSACGSGKKAAAMDDRGKSTRKGKAVDLDYYDSGENDASDTEDICRGYGQFIPFPALPRCARRFVSSSLQVWFLGHMTDAPLS